MLINTEQTNINMQHHSPDTDDFDDRDGEDDHLTYEERLRVDSYKMLMPIIHLPYKPYKYQHRRLHDKLSCSYDNNNATAVTSHQRLQGIVRRVSDVDVSGVVSETDDDESKAHMKEEEDDCKSDGQKSKQNRKEEDAKHQCKMSIKAKTCDGNGGSNSKR